MSTEKTVKVVAKLDEKFKIESTMGNHTVYIDQPTAAGGSDAGPTPLQYFALSLGGCIASLGRIVAMQEGLSLRGMEVEVEGTLDTAVLLGKRDDVRCGFNGFTVKVKLDSDMSTEEQEAFIHRVDERCPISENIGNPTKVSVVLA